MKNQVSSYAVIGDPIGHSLSPMIHQYFAEQAGITLCYQAVQVTLDTLSDFVGHFKQQGGKGFNVTLPLKTAMCQYVTSMTKEAEHAQAINTCRLTPKGQWQGHNTDGLGLVRDLTQRCQVDLARSTILILGAGGATRGILPTLLQAKPRSITLCNRTHSRAVALLQALKLNEKVSTCSFSDLTPRSFDLIINATAAGHQGLLLPIEKLRGVVAYDINYGKATEPFLFQAKAGGCQHVYDGLGMLVEQAAEAFYWWHGVRPKTQTLLTRLR